MSNKFQYPFNPLPWHSSPHDWTGNYQLGHQAQESTQRYVCGTRFITWDGRVYKYCYAIGGCDGGKGAKNWSKPVNITGDAAVIAIGDKFITITLGGSAGFGTDGVVAENELAGGFFIAHDPTPQIRGITGNTAGDTEAIRVYLDAPMSLADDDSYSEIMLNPYLYIDQTGSNQWQSVMCVPNNNITSGNFFWGQTHGPCWVSPGIDWDTFGDSVNERSVYFTNDGTVNAALSVSGDADGEQHAGFIIDQTSGSNDALPFIMLQLSI